MSCALRRPDRIGLPPVPSAGSQFTMRFHPEGLEGLDPRAIFEELHKRSLPIQASVIFRATPK